MARVTMGDIWLPGLPPAYTDWAYCTGVLELVGLSKPDAEVLAAIGGPESGYDYTVINDTPATDDYSVGIWQINYYGSLYAGRTAEFGTPRQLIEGGPIKQAHAAASVFRSQGFMAWANTYTSGDWRKYIGSGPIPHPGAGGGGGLGPLPPVNFNDHEIRLYIERTAKQVKQLVNIDNMLARVGVPGWRP
jgi:hypothetical protein